MRALIRVGVGIDTGTTDLAGAEHLVHLLDGGPADPGAGSDGEPSPYYASTHVVQDGGRAHTAVAASWATALAIAELMDRITASFPGAGVVALSGTGGNWADHRLLTSPSGSDAAVAGATSALRQHRTRSVGRLVRFPGDAVLRGRLSAAEVTAHSCVDAVEGLAGLDVRGDSCVELGDFVRPTWKQGRCVLLVQQSVSGLVPFESRHQIPCCSDREHGRGS